MRHCSHKKAGLLRGEKHESDFVIIIKAIIVLTLIFYQQYY